MRLYEEYAGMTKDERNAVDGRLAASSLFEFDCIADQSRSPPGRAKRVHVGIGGQNIFIQDSIAVFFNARPPLHAKDQIAFLTISL
jgi:hypothetical protein